MALLKRIESLKARHAEVEAQLHAEESSPAQDAAKVHQLKKDKLALKDEIARLENEQECQAA